MRYHEPPFKLKEIKIEVTYECPLDCIHCSSDASVSNSLRISNQKCSDIVLSAIDIGVQKIAFSGGEPLIWDGIVNVVEQAIRGGLDTSIYTSGNVSDVPIVLSKIRKSGVPKLIFSIFGASASVHELVTRVAGSFECTWKTIKLALNMEFPIELHFVPFVQNYADLPRIVDLALENKINRISILRFVLQGRGALMKSFVMNRSQNMRLKQMVLDIREKGYDIRTGSPYNFLLLNDQPECSAAIDRLIIAPDLRIYPCDAFKQIRAEELVNTLDFSSLENYSLSECWERSHYLNAIRRYLTTDFTEPCASCEALELCLSGCLAQKVISNKTLEKSPDPDCILGKTGGHNADRV